MLSLPSFEFDDKIIAQGAEIKPHWSFVAPTRPPAPEVKNQAWVHNPIDAFVLARLEHEGLSPSPTGTPTVENWVNSQNTSTTGTFGVGGTALLSATSGFTSCTAP